MTSSSNLAHDQPIPFDTTSDQKNDPFNFTNVNTSQSLQSDNNKTNTTNDVSSLFTNTNTSSFFSQPHQDYPSSTYQQSDQTKSSVHSVTTTTTAFSTNTQQQHTVQQNGYYQQQQHYGSTNFSSQSLDYNQPLTNQQYQQYSTGNTVHDGSQQYSEQYQQQQQGYQQGQWVQFDPMVHYYYDEQGQYHYYDPNTGQEYDYTQYAYQNNYDPQQQYDNTSSGALGLGQNSTTVTSDSGNTDVRDGTNVHYVDNDISQQQLYQPYDQTMIDQQGMQTTNNQQVMSASTQKSEAHLASIPEAPSPSLEQKQIITKVAPQHEEESTLQKSGLILSQSDDVNVFGNGITADDGYNPSLLSDNATKSAATTQAIDTQSTSVTTTPAGQQWDQVDMDSQPENVSSFVTENQHTADRTIDELGNDLDDLILGDKQKNQSAGSTSTPDFYNLTGSRTATPQLPVESTIICLNPSCQSVNKATSKFCEECGTPFITNGSRAQTPAIPTVPTSPPAVVSAASTSTMYDPSSYQRSYSPGIQENIHPETTVPSIYDPPKQQPQQQHSTHSQQYTIPSATPMYNESQQYEARPAQSAEANIYSAPSTTQQLYPTSTAATSSYNPSSYYNSNNVATTTSIRNQQSYATDPYTMTSAVSAFPTATTQPPVDQDPLQRYKRRPLVRFGFGGKLCVMFPQTIHQQYGGGYDIGMSAKKTSSTIQIKNISEILDGTSTQMACLQSFIGPVLSDPDYSVKNKKKQVITYMNNRITELETSSTMTNSTLDVGTRLLLWKLVKFMIEHDGSIGDSDESNKALLDLLQPQTKLTTADMNNFSVPAYGNIIQNQEDQQGQDLSEITLDKLQDYLARGDRRGAVAYAMQQDLWSHALIISSCVDRELWQAVVRGFSQRELAVTANSKQERIHHHMEGNRQGLRVLYALFSGMGASSMSEFFVIDKQPTHNMGKNLDQTGDGTMAKVHSPLQIGQLDKWQETLGLILANRTTKDFEAITALGDIMKNHGWLNAAHICYLLSPQSSLLSGSDTPYVRYTLLGTMDEQKALMDVDSYLLTELAEFAISLRPGIGNSKCLPHLQGYKLMHAWWLVDIGLVKEASRYCSAINQCIKDYTKESPYLHQHLVAKVKELTDLCNEYHGNRSIGRDMTSWLKPSFKKNTLDSFWGSIEGKFNKFVSGDDTTVEEPTGRKSTEIKASPFETNIEPPARSASAVDFRMQQSNQHLSYLSFKRFK